jgi:hypothetical protein
VSTATPPSDPGEPQSGSPSTGAIAVGVLIAVLVVFFLLVLVRSLTGGDDQLTETPAVPLEPTEVPMPGGGVAPSSVPPDTPPATDTVPDEPETVDRYALGQPQTHDPSNDEARVPYGEVGPHCFVGEECGPVPAAADDLNDQVAGTAGSGTAGDLGGLFGTDASGATTGGATGGDTRTPTDVTARREAAQDAQRVSQGQLGPHCFVGEPCPPLPPSSGGGTRPGSREGTTVPCGELGVHSHVGESNPCPEGVHTRVGTTVSAVPVDSVPAAPSAPTFTQGGRCYQVVSQTSTTAYVREIACPAP